MESIEVKEERKRSAVEDEKGSLIDSLRFNVYS